MGFQRTCDICNAKIDTAGRDPGDPYSTPGFVLAAPGVGRPSGETCLDCLKTIVRTLGERFPSAMPSFTSRMQNFLRGLSELEAANEQWRREHPNTEER